MRQAIKRHPRALVASVALHVVLLGLLSLSLTSSEIPDQSRPQANTVKAVLVDAKKVDDELKQRKQAEENKVQQALAQQKKTEEEKKRKAALKQEESKRKKQAEIKRKQEAEKKRKQEAEKKRLAEAERKKKQETEAKQKQEQKRLAALELEKKHKEEEARKKQLAVEAEQKRLADEAEKKRLAAEAERKRKEEEARQKRLAEEAEIRRVAEEAELKRRLAEEEQRVAEHNRKLNSLRQQYVKLIVQKVESKWLRPTTVSANQSCEVHVRQTALGDVISVNLQECSSDVAFKNSIERAVWAASPLPPPPNPEVFDNEIRFTFRP